MANEVEVVNKPLIAKINGKEYILNPITYSTNIKHVVDGEEKNIGELFDQLLTKIKDLEQEVQSLKSSQWIIETVER